MSETRRASRRVGLYKIRLQTFSLMRAGILGICFVILFVIPSMAFAEGKAKPDRPPVDRTEALKAKIASLAERYDRGDDSYRVLTEFESLGAGAVTVLLDDACTGERSLKKDSRLVTILSQPALNRLTFNQLYSMFSADPKQLCWTNAQLLLATAKGTGHELDISLKLLEHPDTFVRYNILDYLKSMKQKSLPVVHAIIGALADKQNCIRQRASIIFKEIGVESVPELLKSMDHHDPSVRHLAIETLERIGPDAQDAVPAIVRKFNTDDSVMVRVQILRSIPKMGTQKEFIIQFLKEALEDKQPEVREWAARGLDDFKEEAEPAASALRNVANDDKDENVREAAHFAIIRIGPTLLSNFIRIYYIYPLLVILLCLIYYLFFRRNAQKIESFFYFLPAGFGHPLYLAIGMYVMGKTGFDRSHDFSVQLDVFGFTAILIVLFLTRFTFFLYNAWIKTRSPLSGIYPHAFDKFIHIHGYCVWGMPLFLFMIIPNGLLLYFIILFPPLLIGIIILAIMQSVNAIGASMTPEKWAPDVVIIRQENDLNQMPLSPAELRKRKYGGVFVWGLGIMIVGLFIASQFTERLSHQTLYDNRMAAREADKDPNSARYHFLLGQSYERNEKMDQGERLRKAVDEYSKAIELDPKLAGAYEHRANAYRLLTDYRLAIDDFNKCEELQDGVDSNMYYKRAMTYDSLGMKDQMCEDFRSSYCGNYYNKNYIGLVERGLCK